MLISTPNLVRVAALSYEDILELGWVYCEEFIDEEYPNYSHKLYTRKGDELHYYFNDDDRNIFIARGAFEGVYNIRTKLELSDLMRFLGIATNTE
jgi:hypothetical protein